MAQEIKIPVSADVKGAERGANQLSDALDGVAGAAAAIGKETNKAAQGVDRLVDKLEDLVRLKEALGRDGISLSDGDLSAFDRNWRNNLPKGPLGASARRFNSYPDWREGIETAYATPQARQAARRKLQAHALQGTDYARDRMDPGGGGGGEDEGGGGAGGGGGFGAGVNRAKNAAFGFGKSMLALAGINSLMGLAGRAIDNANEESIGTDTLKRRMADLGVDFAVLRDQARAAGQGLGVTSIESVRLAQSYSQIVGNLSYKDMAGVGSSLRNGMGLSRAYGLDLEQGNQFYGMMAKTGVARDDQGQRRLALLIGDAVARSGYSGKVDELLGAVSDYAAATARATLATPNVGAFTAGLTSLLSKGYAGFGPAEAAGLLSGADSSVRHGGGKGEASQNFIWTALKNASPGLSVVDSIGLMEGGLFGTTRGIFGGSGPLAGRGKGVKLNDVTTFEKMMTLMRANYAGKGAGYMAEAMKGAFGVSTQADATALANMNLHGQVGQSMDMVRRAGIDPKTLSVTAMPIMAAIANAKGMGGLQGVHDLLSQRGDLSQGQQKALDAAMGKGSPEEVRKALAIVAKDLSQERTDGDKTRLSIADLNTELTSIGAQLMPSINTIRDAVVSVARHFEPTFAVDNAALGAKSASPYTASAAGKSKAARGLMKMAMGLGMTSMQAAGVLGNAWQESAFDPTSHVLDSDGKIHRGMFQLDPSRWAAYEKWAKSKGLAPETQLPQLMYNWQHDLAPGTRAGGKMRMARTLEGTTAAQVMVEAPAGYIRGMENYQNASGWNNRYGAAQNLLGSVDLNVNVKHPNGAVEKHTVPLNRVGTPQPAGSKGQAPKIPVSYPTTGDYR